MLSLPARTAVTTLIRFVFMWRSSDSNCPVSSVLWTSINEVRSPAATVLAMCTALASGFVMLRVMNQAASKPSTTPTVHIAVISSRARS